MQSLSLLHNTKKKAASVERGSLTILTNNLLLQHLGHCGADISRALHNMDPAFRHNFHLSGSRIIRSADNGSGMSHSASGRSRLPGYKPNYRLAVVLLDPPGCIRFHTAPDLS